MNSVDSTTASNYLFSILKGNQTLKLSYLLRDIKADLYNPVFDYLYKRCKTVSELEQFLTDYAYQLMVENGKMARTSNDLENGQQTADEYFLEKLKGFERPVHYLELIEHVEKAPDDIRHFIHTFYPETEFKRYLKRRSHLFAIRKDDSVWLVESDTVEYFSKILTRHRKGYVLRFMSLRGWLSQAPEHVRNYVNNRYPGTEFLDWLRYHSDVFEVDGSGNVSLQTR